MGRAVHTSTPSISPLHEGGTPLLAPAAEAETENQMAEERSEATGSRLVAELAVPGDWLAPELPPHGTNGTCFSGWPPEGCLIPAAAAPSLPGPAQLPVHTGVLLSSSSVKAEKSQGLCPGVPVRGVPTPQWAPLTQEVGFGGLSPVPWLSWRPRASWREVWWAINQTFSLSSW